MMQIDPSLAGQPQSLSAAYLASVLPEVLQHYGLDQAAVLAQAGIDPALLQRSDALLPLLDALRLFLVVLERTGDAGLGFEIGRRVRPRSYQVLGYAVLSSATLGEAVERLLRFEKLAGNVGRTEMRREGDSVCLHWHCPLAGAPQRFITEAAITGWVTLGQQLVDVQVAPQRVCFRHEAPQDQDRYRDAYGCPVVFAADFDGVEFDSALMALPLTNADPGLSGLMEREASALLADYDIGTNLVNAVRSQLYRMLADGEPGIEGVAQRMGLAVRTLQARLRRQGVSFQEVLDGLRRSLAEIYLRDARLSLTEIALLLGFAEQSSFTRAFRRWRGMSPAAFRQQT
ncbi:AraC family transcriptional regulator [Isoalcanivorax indicus]|uniref:AraC family transcriptional regulator n=1 Tax=Isoalcanivorax indicus TaxID=2202653 RepID=UPI001FEB9872|nr:AraC family transcriptional regulator [Isoalcanivorax indicus]